jgi:hypothetical protein
VFKRAALDRGQQRVNILDQDVGGLGQLHRKGGVQHVRGGHALMHEARFGSDLFGNPVEEGDHVMLEDGFLGVNGGHVDLGVGRPPVPQRLGAACGHNAQLAQLLRGMGFDLEPDLVTGFGFPDRGHRGAA